MELRELLTALERAGSAAARRTCLRHGARAPVFGVGYAELRRLQQRAGRDQRLAQRLWDSGIHDARVLATMVADPAAMGEALLDRWVKDADNRLLQMAFAQLAGRSAGGLPCALRWIDAASADVIAAGWTTLAVAAGDAAQRDEIFAALLPRLVRTIHGAPNAARYAMNNCLIAIGGRPALTGQALAAAERIGDVEVDHGDTSCETPRAREYIEKMAARRAGGRRPAAKGRRPARRAKGR